MPITFMILVNFWGKLRKFEFFEIYQANHLQIIFFFNFQATLYDFDCGNLHFMEIPDPDIQTFLRNSYFSQINAFSPKNIICQFDLYFSCMLGMIFIDISKYKKYILNFNCNLLYRLFSLISTFSTFFGSFWQLNVYMR